MNISKYFWKYSQSSQSINSMLTNIPVVMSDFGAYLKASGKRFQWIDPKKDTKFRTIAWSSGTLILLRVMLPNRRYAVARIYCATQEILQKTRLHLSSGDRLSVKLGFQLTRSIWCAIPQV
jgi:hypothetical protein